MVKSKKIKFDITASGQGRGVRGGPIRYKRVGVARKGKIRSSRISIRSVKR